MGSLDSVSSQGWFQGPPIMGPPYGKLPIPFPYQSHWSSAGIWKDHQSIRKDPTAVTSCWCWVAKACRVWAHVSLMHPEVHQWEPCCQAEVFVKYLSKPQVLHNMVHLGRVSQKRKHHIVSPRSAQVSRNWPQIFRSSKSLPQTVIYLAVEKTHTEYQNISPMRLKCWHLGKAGHLTQKVPKLSFRWWHLIELFEHVFHFEFCAFGFWTHLFGVGYPHPWKSSFEHILSSSPGEPSSLGVESTDFGERHRFRRRGDGPIVPRRAVCYPYLCFICSKLSVILVTASWLRAVLSCLLGFG